MGGGYRAEPSPREVAGVDRPPVCRLAIRPGVPRPVIHRDDTPSAGPIDKLPNRDAYQRRPGEIIWRPVRPRSRPGRPWLRSLSRSRHRPGSVWASWWFRPGILPPHPQSSLGVRPLPDPVVVSLVPSWRPRLPPGARRLAPHPSPVSASPIPSSPTWPGSASLIPSSPPRSRPNPRPCPGRPGRVPRSWSRPGLLARLVSRVCQRPTWWRPAL
jgi:hypothetical protein